jgi:hypothetical protein
MSPRRGRRGVEPPDLYECTRQHYPPGAREALDGVTGEMTNAGKNNGVSPLTLPTDRCRLLGTCRLPADEVGKCKGLLEPGAKDTVPSECTDLGRKSVTIGAIANRRCTGCSGYRRGREM